MLNAHAQTQEASSSPALAASHTHRVLELFAGVGGFHYGLEQANEQRQAQGLPRAYDVVWANQWEPGCKHQHASRVYAERWGLAPVNRNLFEVLDDADEMARIDSLEPTMLVGGFPCQDYSVARPSSKSEGLRGKKGVLWWAVHGLLQSRLVAGLPIETVMLENVDQLINSSKECRGRDFAIILSSLQSLGYAVAWQVVNAANYGYAQKRKRVFIVAVHETTPAWQAWRLGTLSPANWIASESPLAQGLPVQVVDAVRTFPVGADILETQETYRAMKGNKSLFANAGLCVAGTVWTARVAAATITDHTDFVGRVEPLTLGDVIGQTADVPPEFYVPEEALARWQFLKGAKSIERVKADGSVRPYSEGAMSFPDRLDAPSRTVITSEGGRAASRTTHVVRTSDGRLRRLTPDELDALNGFPRGFTCVDGVSDAKRAFLMGNALVTGVVARIGAYLAIEQPLAAIALPSEAYVTSNASCVAVWAAIPEPQPCEPLPATQGQDALGWETHEFISPDLVTPQLVDKVMVQHLLVRPDGVGPRLAGVPVLGAEKGARRRLDAERCAASRMDHEVAAVPDNPIHNLEQSLGDFVTPLDIRFVCDDGCHVRG